jgi:pimeloyl-ACP methyl ester carboxylesterase
MLGHDLARRHPRAVDRLITLGSPPYSTDPRQSRGPLFYDEYAAAHLPEYSTDSWRPPLIASMPATSIFSKAEGVVRWQTFLHPPGPLSENIEVYGSHCGLGFHPATAYVILDRLAAPTASHLISSRAQRKSAFPVGERCTWSTTMRSRGNLYPAR